MSWNTFGPRIGARAKSLISFHGTHGTYVRGVCVVRARTRGRVINPNLPVPTCSIAARIAAVGVCVGSEGERRYMSGKGQWRNSNRGEAGHEESDLLPRDKSADSSMAFAAGGSPLDPLWTPEQVARRLNVSPDWVRDHSSRKQPRLPVIRLGGGPGRAGLLRYRASQIEEFIEEMERLSSRNSRRI